MLISFQKKTAFEEMGKLKGLLCVWLQGAGGIDTHILVPDTRAMPYGVTGIVG